MPDVLRALAISASMLIVIAIATIGISYVTVKRGEAEMAKDSKHGHSHH